MTNVELVHQAATALGLLTPDGQLTELDSLTILDLVEKLEVVASVSIPTASLRQESFESVETIAQLLTELQRENAANG
jgi:acyl carrier protein